MTVTRTGTRASPACPPSRLRVIYRAANEAQIEDTLDGRLSNSSLRRKEGKMSPIINSIRSVGCAWDRNLDRSRVSCPRRE